MHGRKKLTVEQREQKAARESNKIKQYCVLIEGFEQLPGAINEILPLPESQTTFDEWNERVQPLLDQILHWNPEYYTVWNYRRRFIKSLHQTTEASVWNATVGPALLTSEKKITQDTLKINPKSYWVWLHRRWTIEYIEQSHVAVDWPKELALCNQLLDLDSRNFHCWDYRRTVLGHLSVNKEQELEFSMHKICQNFSNYSAWHYRSALLTDKRELGREDLEDDLELVRSAVFTEPKDQSPWLYHRWATQQIQNTSTFPLCAYKTTTNQMVVVFEKPVICQRKGNISLTVNGTPKEFPAIINSNGNRQYCQSWLFDLSSISSDDLLSIILPRNYFCSRQKVSNREIEIKFTPQTPHLWITDVDFSKRNDVLAGELEVIQELISLEPDCKWALLTYCFAVMELQKTQGDLTGEQWSTLKRYLKHLQTIDAFHRRFYEDYLTDIAAVEKMDCKVLIAHRIISPQIVRHCSTLKELDVSTFDSVAISALANYPLINLECVIAREEMRNALSSSLISCIRSPTKFKFRY